MDTQRDPQPATILVVDDKPENIELLTEILDPVYRTQAATGGERALKIAASDKAPDLILLDVMMPGIDGYEVCRRLKADPATHDIPVIFVTAMEEVEEEERGLELGAVDYITKPVSAAIVLARVKTHLELRRSHAQVQAQARTLEQQNESLRTAIRLREEVERIARHDLKTPLNSIAAIPALLREGRTVSADEEELLAMVERSARRVLTMVNLSLDLYRMEDGSWRFTPEPVDLGAVVRTVMRDLHTHARSKALQLAMEPADAQFWAGADELLCYTIVANLLKNAVEAAPDGTCVSVRLEPGNPLRVAIHNQGAVPLPMRETFFEKYTTHGKRGGTGLGTYSARLMARVQRGDLTVQTSDSEGTTLVLSLEPLPAQDKPRAAASAAAAADAQAGADVAAVRVLVADDDAANLLVLTRLLPRQLHVRTATNGRAAVDALQAEPAELVFLDLEMPVMGGLEALRLIREHQAREEQAPSKMVAFSAHDDEATRRRCMEAGFDFYLKKPARRHEILALFAAGATPPQTAPAPATVWIDADFADVIQPVLESRRALVDDMRQALASGDRDTLRAIAHKLLGSFSAYGFDWASRICRELELGAATLGPEALAARIEALGRHLASVEVRFRPAA